MRAEDPDADAPITDLWRLSGLPGGLPLASYLTAGPGYAEQYRLIVDTLLDQQQTSLTGVAHDDLEVLLRNRLAERVGEEHASELLDGFALASRMAQLHTWGVVDAWDERPTRDEDFLRNSNRYQLTLLAAQFHRAVRSLGEDSALSLAATFAPRTLRAQLELMVISFGTDPGEVAAAWSVAQNTLAGMAEAASGWQARLAGALSGTQDAEKIAQLQDTLRRYVDMWGAGVDTHSEALVSSARTLAAASSQEWRRVALQAAGAEAPESDVAEQSGQYLATMNTVLAWFDGPRSQAKRLRRQMRDVISPMVRGRRALAAVGGHVSRRAELLSLASAVESAKDDVAAWDLWCTATGLYAARHLALGSPQPGGPAGSVSFWDAEPTQVEGRLRRQGPRSGTGRPARIADRSAGRAAARAVAAAGRLEAARTHAVIAARSGQRLSAWDQIPGAQLDILLMFLTTLGPDRTGEITATTGDGLWQLRAEPAEAGAPAAVVRTEAGRLVHADIRLHITSTAPAGV